MVKIINQSDATFNADFAALLKANRNTENDVSDVVKDILQNIKEHGDEALIDYTAKFDELYLTSNSMRVSDDEIKESLEA